MCARHRNRLGIGWRGRQIYCQVPRSICNHKGKPVKGDRSIDKRHSREIMLMSSELVPIGSGLLVYKFAAFLLTTIYSDWVGEGGEVY